MTRSREGKQAHQQRPIGKERKEGPQISVQKGRQRGLSEQARIRERQAENPQKKVHRTDASEKGKRGASLLGKGGKIRDEVANAQRRPGGKGGP